VTSTSTWRRICDGGHGAQSCPQLPHKQCGRVSIRPRVRASSSGPRQPRAQPPTAQALSSQIAEAKGPLLLCSRQAPCAHVRMFACVSEGGGRNLTGCEGHFSLEHGLVPAHHREHALDHLALNEKRTKKTTPPTQRCVRTQTLLLRAACALSIPTCMPNALGGLARPPCNCLAGGADTAAWHTVGEIRGEAERRGKLEGPAGVYPRARRCPGRRRACGSPCGGRPGTAVGLRLAS
jgi:hypothetical protein